MKGQGFVEYSLIIILVIVVAVALIAVTGLLLGVNNDVCLKDKTSFECKNKQMSECLKSELYTRDECLTLIGEKK